MRLTPRVRHQNPAVAAVTSPPRGSEVESDVILSARAGDAAAFTAVVRRYHPRLRALASRLLWDRSAVDDVLQIDHSSLYPALHRMEEAGWIRSEWDVSPNNRRARFYTLTAAGRRRLAEEEEHWNRLTVAVDRVLKLA